MVLTVSMLSDCIAHPCVSADGEEHTPKWLDPELFDMRHPGNRYSSGETVPLMRREEQHRAHASYSPAHRRLHVWGCQPGSFAVIEACLRRTSRGDNTGIRIAMQALSTLTQAQSACAVSMEMLAACSSLVASARKLRHRELEGGIVTFDMWGEECVEVEDALQRGLKDVNMWVIDKGYFPTADPLSEKESARMRVFAILSLWWVEEQNNCFRTLIESGDPQYALEIYWPRCHLEDACHVHLAQITEKSLLQPGAAGATSLVCRAAHQRQVASLWDGFARTSFHGRLLPGCSHLGCTNLGGVSETSLPTQLCSGCRRVRYCCSKCQRDAWVRGGHGPVCGRGTWAVGAL